MAKEIRPENAADRKSTEQTFAVSTLRGNCIKLFNVTSSTFDGAFFGLDISKKYTIAEAKKIITTWLRKEIGK